MTHTSTEQPEALERLRQRLKFTHARHGHTARFVEATESDVKAVIDLADSLRARVQELETQTAHMADLVELADYATKKLEASQAQRVPLTYTQINSILHSVPEDDDDAEWMLTDAQLLKIIRAAEAAHGITQEKQG